MTTKPAINTGTSWVKVPSESDPAKTYIVEIENGRAWWCECKDWQVRRRECGCKHMRGVNASLQAVADMLESFIE